MSNFLWPHRLQHDRLLCPPVSPGVCWDSCPLSWWYYLTISFSATPFSFCLQSLPGSFPTSQLFVSSGQSIGSSASMLLLFSHRAFSVLERCVPFSSWSTYHMSSTASSPAPILHRPDDQSPLAGLSPEFLSGCFDHRNAGPKVSPSLWKLQPSVMDTECNFCLEQVFDFCMVITSYIACSTTWGKKRCKLAPDIFPFPGDSSNIH